MMRVGEFIIKQSNSLLENKQHAILYAVALSIMPFASWISVAIIILVTLRKGAQVGFEVMLPALVVHSVPLMMLVPLDSALINAFITYIPCYLVAVTLRQTSSWQAVFGVFFLQALIGALLIKFLAPDFAMEQLIQLKKILGQYSEYSELGSNGNGGISSVNLAQLFLGIQILSVVVSTTTSLLCARSIQAKLFMPGGLIREIRDFRCGRVALVTLIGISLASYYEVPLGINLLPLVLCYFLLSGFSLVFFILAQKRQVKVGILLFLLIVLKPVFFLFAYIVFGSLDSIFNFRLYLPEKVREST